jgi:translation initiation factor 4A
MVFVCLYIKLSNFNILKFNHRLSPDAQEFITSYDEVHDTFDAMGLKENLLRGIYAYGI